jgi:hypothetical protein
MPKQIPTWNCPSYAKDYNLRFIKLKVVLLKPSLMRHCHKNLCYIKDFYFKKTKKKIVL